MSHLDIAAAIDRLYEQTAGDPAGHGDATGAEWYEAVLAVAGPEVDKAVLRQVRRSLRLADRMARYWCDPDHNDRLPSDWRLAADEALGSRGWEPALTIALLGLEAEPTPECFAECRKRWRQVHFEPWMEGITYSDWLGQREQMTEGGSSG